MPPGRGLPAWERPGCPEAPRSLRASVAVRQVLTMTSGVSWVEDYRDPDSPASRMLARWRTGQGGLRDCLMSIHRRHPPGTRYAYSSADSLVLDWVRERATGRTFAEAIGDLWQLCGADQPASIGWAASSTTSTGSVARWW
ncbi:MAG: serine hydrolase domain-containing protein [Nocardioidaceae bacterium]